jgi:MFS family permease
MSGWPDHATGLGDASTYARGTLFVGSERRDVDQRVTATNFSSKAKIKCKLLHDPPSIAARSDGRDATQEVAARMRHRPFAVLNRDGRLLFATRVGRMFAYGFLSVVLVLYLAALGMDDLHIGLLLTLTLLGDSAMSLLLTTRADAVGRRRVLRIGALLMAIAGVVFALSGDFWILVLAATVGVISVTGGDVGPFQAVEQASLSHIVPHDQRTRIFGWYSLTGSFAAAAGALAAGLIVGTAQGLGLSLLDSYRVVVIGYAALGVGIAIAIGLLSPAIEVARDARSPLAGRFGLHRSRRTVAQLSVLFGFDSFGGALAAQSLVAYWFTVRFGAAPELLGAIFFAANILAGLSALAATRLAARFGLIRTMVFTHLPTNVLLILVPLMPNLGLAALLLLFRFSLSSMDVPARSSFVVAVVDPDERSAAAGITAVARSLGSAPAPAVATPLFGIAQFSGVPFVLAGVIKITYDLVLYRRFRAVHLPEEVDPDLFPIEP